MFETAADLLLASEAPDTYVVKGVVRAWSDKDGVGMVAMADGQGFFGRGHWTGLRFPVVGEDVDVVFGRGSMTKILKVRPGVKEIGRG
jgi:hypothetical protein